MRCGWSPVIAGHAHTDYESIRALIRGQFPERARVGLQPDPLIVDTVVEGTIVDFLLSMPGYDQNVVTRAVHLDLGDLTAWVCSPEDLIVQKVIANRVKDWLDIESVLIEQRGKLDYAYIEDWAGQFAELLDEPERMTQYLATKERVEELAKRAGL